MKNWHTIRAQKLSEAQLENIDAAIEEELLELDLRELREVSGLTQVELAARVGITQSELSKLERRNNQRVATLRRYVQALGGTLELTAVVNGKRIRMTV